MNYYQNRGDASWLSLELNKRISNLFGDFSSKRSRCL